MVHNNGNCQGEADWGVIRCECGVYRVRLGSVVLELERHDFLRLELLLSRAAEHFGLRESAPVESHQGVTH